MTLHGALDYGRHRGRSAAFTTAVRAAVVVLRITMVSFDYMKRSQVDTLRAACAAESPMASMGKRASLRGLYINMLAHGHAHGMCLPRNTWSLVYGMRMR